MNNKQSQVEIEDELVTVRILSVVFITFMILIVGSYSDAPNSKLAESDQKSNSSQLIMQTSNKGSAISQSPLIMKTRLNTQLLNNM